MVDRPRLKTVTVHRSGPQLVICPRALRRVYLDDPTGAIAALLELLREGKYPVDELRTALAERGFPVTVAELAGALSTLDELGVVEDAAAEDELDQATLDRHESNLRFYDLFARLDRTSAGMHRAVRDARVLLLGVGGLGSGILQSLVGLGVGEVSIVDFDVVETKNLARQFTYGLAAVGRRKVEAAAEWVAGYSGGTRVVPVHEQIADADRIRELGAGADIVVCAADTPGDIQLLVNEACFALGVPFVAGGLNYSTLSYWSVRPGVTPCRCCLELHRVAETAELPPVLRGAPFIERELVNRATGPVIQLLCGLMSMEVWRYLTGAEPPVAGARYHIIELADGMAANTAPWERHPDCPLCTVA
jgi:molybdopterin/thiamine biosynthesis adenylyltransferase